MIFRFFFIWFIFTATYQSH